MERLAGSRTAHEAMNRQMAAMLGSAAADRMHRLVGLRYAGCATGATMGPAMMGGGAASGAGWGAMMGSRDVSWMRNGTWQHMDRGAWQRVGTAWMGPGMMRSRNDGWSAADVLAAIAGAVLVGVLIAFAIPKPAGQDPGGPPRKAAETSR